MKIDVLDHGYVQLASYTQPARDPDGSFEGNPSAAAGAWTGDLEIVRSARTSYNADWRTGDDDGKDAKLIRRLWKDQHLTPFEAMTFTFEIQAPLFVVRQWHRHRTWSYNEVSSRYTEMSDLFYIPDIEHIGMQSKDNKQGREIHEETEFNQPRGMFRDDVRDQTERAYGYYQEALRSGISRELARLHLPVSIYTRMFGTVNLRNLFHFLELRLDPHAQYEIRVYAEALLKLVEPICPVACAAFRESPVMARIEVA
jgi:thymidylate synthase (FAD)